MNERVVDALSGRGCRYCDGTVARGEYRGDDAVVCEACGTPAFRSF